MSRVTGKPAGGFRGPLPLTPTLSLREREQHAHRASFSSVRPASPASGFVVRLETILPLPTGEGRGEGESGELQAGFLFPATHVACHS